MNLLTESEYLDIIKVCQRESDIRVWLSYDTFGCFLKEHNDVLICPSVRNFKYEKRKEYQNFILCLDRPGQIILRNKANFLMSENIDL